MKQKAWDFLVITFGTAIVAAAVYFFMMPGHVAVGSVAALAIVLSNFIPLPISVLTMIMNIVLLVLGYLLVGKEFGLKTIYAALLMPAMLAVLEVCFPHVTSFTADQTLDTVGYCVLVALGQAVLFTANASSGGLDIVAKIINKYTRMELGKAVALAGMAVALTSALVYDKKTLVLSVLGTYFNGQVVDHFIFGSTIKKRVCIISRKQETILEFILKQLHSGATCYHAYGAYSDAVHTEINTIVDKHEYQKLMSFVTKVDPDAFVTVYAVNEMMYKPKR